MIQWIFIPLFIDPILLRIIQTLWTKVFEDGNVSLMHLQICKNKVLITLLCIFIEQYHKPLVDIQFTRLFSSVLNHSKLTINNILN